MDEEKRKERTQSKGTISKIFGRICEWLGIFIFIGPGLSLVVIGFVGDFSPPREPLRRDLVPGHFIAGCGLIFLMYGGMIVYYFFGKPDK